MKVGDFVYYKGKKVLIIDLFFDGYKPYATTYKIEIKEPYQQRFWVHNTELVFI